METQDTPIKVKTKLEIIDETIIFYSEDVSRRAANPDGNTCLYQSYDGRNCAVGRCLAVIPKECIQCDPEYLPRSPWAHELLTGDWIVNGHEYGPKGVLKPEYDIKGDDAMDFWDALQRLHDNNYFWQPGGLTDAGKEYAEELRRQFA